MRRPAAAGLAVLGVASAPFPFQDHVAVSFADCVIALDSDSMGTELTVMQERRNSASRLTRAPER